IARQAIESVGLSHYMEHAYTKLSGGEAQLVKIARAIAQETDMIIFDEPTAHLDFRHELNVIRFIADTVKNKGISVIMATHFPNHALFLESRGLPTRVAMMENGVFGAVGKPSEVLNQENMERIFKVKTKNFIDGNDRYIVPVDFCEGGEWR
ncbi:MAG: ABC transporter ATP-binding protein, partial [Eubacterium sp.]